MRPKCVLTVNGAPVAGIFWEKLKRVSVHDHEGGKADSIDLVLEDGPPVFLNIPQKGDEIRCWLGYQDGPFDFMGAFEVQDPEVECLPWALSIKGKSADLREKAKQHRRRSWEGKTFKDVAGEMAREEGLEAQVDAEIGAFIPDNKWFGQDNESNLHWLDRWADRLDGIVARKNGKLIVAKRGAGLTPGGASMIPLVITPPMIIKNSCRVHWGNREKHGKVNAEYHDTKSGKRKRVSAASDADSDSVYTHRHATSGKSEARHAARGRARFLKSGGLTTSVAIEGNPLAKAGAPMTYLGVRPQVDGLQFIVDTATHSFSRGASYRTELRGRAKEDGGDDAGET